MKQVNSGLVHKRIIILNRFFLVNSVHWIRLSRLKPLEQHRSTSYFQTPTPNEWTDSENTVWPGPKTDELLICACVNRELEWSLFTLHMLWTCRTSLFHLIICFNPFSSKWGILAWGHKWQTQNKKSLSDQIHNHHMITKLTLESLLFKTLNSSDWCHDYEDI